MQVAFDCDDAGLPLKQVILEELQDLGVDAVDLNLLAERKVDYPDIGHNLAKRVAAKEFERGILVCGTGLGMSMAANRFAGVRAAVCTCEFMSRMARAHNNANVLCLGERVVGQGLGLDIARAFLATNFEGARHLRRISQFDTFTAPEKP